MTSEKEHSGFFKRLKEGLAKTHQAVTRRIEEITLGKREISKELLDNLEEILIASDLGVATVDVLMQKIKWRVERKDLQDADRLTDVLKEGIYDILAAHEKPLIISPDIKPYVILTVGVNGTGKTTTIAKMANIFKTGGHSVLLAAADTFRAAAIDQLEIWGERVGCRVIKHKHGADPSAVVFDALKSAQSKNIDIVIIDTAGRLHTQAPLMEEIKKIQRIISREMPGAPHETVLVLDATIGQNAIAQAKFFKDALNISGIVLTKLDGTAKGGVIVGISESLGIPVRFVGVGEKIDDLREFNARDFVDALFED
jgi:fused signal recognition particle receptor